MRLVLAAVVAIVWPSLVVAQSSTSTLAPVPPLPPIGLPLPEISGTLTPIGLSPTTTAPKAQPLPRQRLDGHHRRFPQPSAVFFVPLYYPWPVVPVVTVPGTTVVGASTSSRSGDELTSTRVDELKEQLKAELREELKSEQNLASEGSTPRGDGPPPRPSTFYYIPGCYMGNVPPSEVALPANCDHTRLVTWKP